MLVCTGPRFTQGEAETLFKTIGDRLKINGLDSEDLRSKEPDVIVLPSVKEANISHSPGRGLVLWLYTGSI